MSDDSTKLPITLALELSQQTGSVAMCSSNGTIMEKVVDSGNREQDDVMPSIEAIAHELHILPKTIDCVIVSVGPGGFTGLRSTVAIAKMIALVSGAALIPVETAMSVVANAGCEAGTYLVVSGVKQDSFWLSTVRVNDESITCSAALSNTKDLSSLLDETSVLFGDSFIPQSVVTIAKGENVVIQETSTSAKTLLELGLRLYKEKKIQAIDPLKLAPLYPREPEAVRVWNKNHKKAKTDN
ncbi:MAG: tRNA (adenosine(37)-N6)-threonylcarbamoyltransferase complex dimerization subunit type 1 TsaB [Planctomycetes bacterium]|nr:tRNA (adenosine(37)-N6)-threonylcarbamoyltransferase complex dimerization subunit type 1 TsaB [Planctomycetota bacterium]